MTDIHSADRWGECFTGVLLGTAVGDSLGLPAEGMSRERIHKRWSGQWSHRFLFGHGMVSDDTEHTLFVAQALLRHPDNVAAFQRCLAWKLQLWILGIPAGTGLATLKATLRLWMGVSPTRSGVWSAGNGPAMRSAILGAYFADDSERRRAFVSAATRLTHTDPRAQTAALAVSEAAAWAVNPEAPSRDLLGKLSGFSDDPEWKGICLRLTDALEAGRSVEDFADSLGLQRGVTGYAYHSVPVALYAWLRHFGDFRLALTSALNCGGDTDTVGAIVGALAAATTGVDGIPPDWLKGIFDWPRSVNLLVRVGHRLALQKKSAGQLGPVRYFWPAVVLRNAVFLTCVLLHGIRRLAPPY